MVRCFPAWLMAAGLSVTAQTEPPLFSFGVIADVQYADQPTLGPRAYRDSIAKLEQCSAALAQERLAFVVHLGDLVDGGIANLDRILPVWERLPGPRYHVLGNHDFVAPREALLARLKIPGAYYHFSWQGWRFIVLDGMNISVAGSWSPSDPHALAGTKLLEALRQERARNAQTWNGAAGPEQRDWLKHTLDDAARKNQRAIVFCHFPVLAESCRPDHLLWDHADVVGVLESQDATAAYINGHDHRGGYAARNGIHYVTIPGMVEHDAASTCKVVDAYPNHLMLRSAGQTGGQSLALRGRP